MFFCGYNFMKDEDSMSPTPAFPTSFTKVEIENCICDEISITNATDSYNTTRDLWDYNTILISQFKNSLNGGNVDFNSSTVSKLRVKRRKIESLSDWWTIAEFDFEPSLNFMIYDTIAESEQEYEYALVPVSSQDVEGSYMTSTVLSQFDDTYIADRDSIYKLRYNLMFDNIERIHKVGVFEPLESRYPIVVKNSTINYSSGNITALVLSQSTEDANGVIDKKQEIKHRKALIDFLTNGKSKLLKTSNGEVMIIYITGNPSIQLRNELGQQIADVSTGQFVEIGDSANKEDLYYNNLLASLS